MGTRERQRTLTNLFLAIGALVLGLVAQDYFWRFLPAPKPTDGLFVYAATLVLFTVALLRKPPLPGLPPGPRMTHPYGRHVDLDVWRFAGATLFLSLAGAATIVSLALFREDMQPQLRWVFYLSAPVLFLAAVHVLQPPRAGRPLYLFSSNLWLSARIRWQGIALIAILAVGAFFRLYRFTELPYGLWYDEADNGLWARQILADPNFRPIYVPSTNLPAHFLYLVALAFRLLGDSMHAIRAVAVVFGMLTIVVAYLCGRELGGSYFGLALAALLAVSRWDVNWSRIGMHGVTVPFFELWVVATLLRGLRTGCLAAFGWAGVALGLGLCFYSPFRLFPAVLLGFLLAWGVEWLARVRRENRGWPVTRHIHHALAAWGVPAFLFLSGVLIAVAPVVQFALAHPDVFWDRARRVSLFKDPEAEAHPVRTLLDSTGKHLLMFHYRGDPNGRHNLPGAPMLDRLSGVLMAFGVAICILRPRHPRSVLLLLWLLIPLSGGILSTWFEAPQSLRSIGSLPAVCALICLPMEWFAGEWRRVFPRPGVRRRLALLALSALLVIGVENAFTYFYLWGRDFASWAAFSAAETHLAQDINHYRQDYDLRFDPLLTAHLATRYLAPDYEVYHHFDPGTVFPLRGTSKKGIVLFIAPDTHPLRTQAEELYPSVQVETFAHPYSGFVVLYKYVFLQEVVAATQGLDARYVPLQSEQVDIDYRTDAAIDFAWEDAPPKPYPFQAIWTGGLLAPEYGAYTLYVELPGRFVLELDGQRVLAGQGAASRQIVMAQGVHALGLDGHVTGPGPVRLFWQTPGDSTARPVPGDALYRAFWPTRGLVGRFYPNASWSGEPEMVRIDRQVAYYFHFLPLPRPYTAEWTGRLAVPVSDLYRLGVSAISSASLYVDGRALLEGASGGQVQEGEMYLAAGMHDIRLRFLDAQAHSQIYLYWQLPDGVRQLIPPEALFPPAEGAWWPQE